MIAAMARSTPRNPEVAEQFDLLADLLELEGADTFRVVAYRRAADEPNPQTGRRLLGDGLGAVLAVVATLREHPLVEKVSEAGSVRRRKETFRDLDVIATASDPATLTDSFTKLGWVDEIAAKGPTK